MISDRIHRLMSRQPVDRPLVIAHRGLSSAYPENTLPSFEAAVSGGADMVELDVHATRDGELICVHDPTLRRYLPPSNDAELLDRPIEAFALDELRGLDVGSWKDARFAGTGIPTLEEVLARVPEAVFLIERKGGTPEQTLQTLWRARADDRVILQSFDWDYLAALHALAPQMPLAALGGGPLGARLERLRSTGAQAAHWSERISSGEVAAFHEAGLPVWIYTLNTELQWRGGRAMQIDGITTDHSDALRAWL